MITVNGRAVRTVAELRVGDRLPTPNFGPGHIEIAVLEYGTNVLGGPTSLINWSHDQATDPNAAPSRWSHHLEIHPDSDGFRLVLPDRATGPRS